PLATVQSFDFKLGGNDGLKPDSWTGALNEPVEIRQANDEFQQFTQGGAGWVPPSTVSEVLGWVKRFTALEAFFLRVRAVQDAAFWARVPYSSALALYRTE